MILDYQFTFSNLKTEAERGMACLRLQISSGVASI